jgi:hypothetical protein
MISRTVDNLFPMITGTVDKLFTRQVTGLRFSTSTLVFSTNIQIFSSETRRHNEMFLCRNEVWEIMCKIFIFHANRTTNMAAY